MNDSKTIDELTRHAYVDGRLDADQEAAMAAYLAAHPDEARLLGAWRRDAAALKAAWQDSSVPVNPALDPAFIRRRMQERRNIQWKLAASVFIALGVGGITGWQLNGNTGTAPSLALGSQPMQDAIQAYRVFTANPALRADAMATDTDLQQWISTNFSNAQHLPDLSAKGYFPVSARMLVTEEGPAAVVLYENADGRRTGFYIRPPGPGNKMLPKGHRQDGDLATRYWSANGYNYALVGSNTVVMNTAG